MERKMKAFTTFQDVFPSFSRDVTVSMSPEWVSVFSSSSAAVDHCSLGQRLQPGEGETTTVFVSEWRRPQIVVLSLRPNGPDHMVVLKNC